MSSAEASKNIRGASCAQCHGTPKMGGKSLDLTAKEKANIISFLKMLTDSTFISNPAFSNPHLSQK